MTNLFNVLSALKPEEKLAAIEFLWDNLEIDVDQLPSPDWHGELIRERLENPSPEPALPVEEAMQMIKERVRARSNQT
ncbi:MAG: addiction module protein [Pirellulaceae bacterium]|nr:addiction module protein [Pirellulaceae bacterium]